MYIIIIGEPFKKNLEKLKLYLMCLEIQDDYYFYYFLYVLSIKWEITVEFYTC